MRGSSPDLALAMKMVGRLALLLALGVSAACDSSTATNYPDTLNEGDSALADSELADSELADSELVDSELADSGTSDAEWADSVSSDADLTDISPADSFADELSSDIVADGHSDVNSDAGNGDASGADATLDDGAGDGAGDTTAPPPTEAEQAAMLLALLDAGQGAQAVQAYSQPACGWELCVIMAHASDSEVNSVQLRGSFDQWGPGQAMNPVPGAPTWWWATVDAPAPSAVVTYKFVIAGEWLVDGLNPYFAFGGFGPDSALYGAARGRITALHDVYSPQLGNTRSLYVYLPRAYLDEPDRAFAVLWMADGFNVFTNPAAPFGDWAVDATADSLMGAGEVEPVIIVGIDTDDRLNEYVYAPFSLIGEPATPRLAEYAAFVTTTAEAAVAAQFRVLPPPRRSIAGSSLGGLSSLWIAWHHEAYFESVASLSGSFWVGEDPEGDPELPSLREIILSTPTAPAPDSLRVYLDSGDSTASGTVTYLSDSRVYTDWTRNALIARGWSNRPEWDTDAVLASPPDDLPTTTAVANVPALPWSADVPAGYADWAAYLRPDANLLCLVGPAHSHNEAAWSQRFPAALRFLFPSGGAP